MVGVLSTVIISLVLCLRCPAAASAVRACVALLSIMPIICGPILISSVSLPVAVLASAMCGIFCLRGPVLWLVSSYVATLFRLRAPARTAATRPACPTRRRCVARAARPGAVFQTFHPVRHVMVTWIFQQACSALYRHSHANFLYKRSSGPKDHKASPLSPGRHHHHPHTSRAGHSAVAAVQLRAQGGAGGA